MNNMSQYLERQLLRVERALKQPGLLNDLLAIAERHTGVDRVYLAPGKILL